MKVIGLWLKMLAAAFFISMIIYAFSQPMPSALAFGSIGLAGWLSFVIWFNKSMDKDNLATRVFSLSLIVAEIGVFGYMLVQKDFTWWVWSLNIASIAYWTWRYSESEKTIAKNKAAMLEEEQKQKKKRVVEINFM